MKNKKILIVTDPKIGIIPTRGRVKNVINLIVSNIYKLIFNIIIFNSLRNNNEVTLICNRSFDLPKNKELNVVYYDNIFFEVDWLRIRKNIDKFINHSIGGFKYKGVDLSEIVRDRLAIHLSVDIFPYLDYFSNNLNFNSFDEVKCVTPFSASEKVAIWINKKNKKRINFSVKFMSLLSPVANIVTYSLAKKFSKESIKQTTSFIEEKIYLNEVEKNSIIFLASRQIQLKSLVPIIGKVISLTGKRCYVLTDSLNFENFSKDFTKQKIDAINLFGIVSPSDRKKLFLSISKKSEKWWNNIVDKKREVGSFEDFVLKTDKFFLANQAKYIIPLASVFVECGIRLFDQTSPKKIILFSEKNFSEKMIGQLSKRFSINSILIFPSNNTDVQDITNFNVADNILVTGEYMKRKIANHGINKNKIKIVGDPRITNYKILNPLDEKKFRKINEINEDKKIITAMSLYSTEIISENEKRLFLIYLNDAILKFKDVTLIIKPHPNEDQELLKAQIKKWKLNCVMVDKYTNLYDLLGISEAVAFIWSMTGFEAMMLDKPTIAVNVFSKNYDSYIPYGNSGASFIAINQTEIEKTIDLILNNPQSNRLKQMKKNRKRFLDSFIKSDVDSLDKIAREITL